MRPLGIEHRAYREADANARRTEGASAAQT
jgi:hypothetical protein